MEFNLQGFIDVLTLKVSWLDANFFWVIVSVSIYFAGLVLVWMIVMIANELYQEWFDRQREKGRGWLAYLVGGTIIFYIIIILLELSGVDT